MTRARPGCAARSCSPATRTTTPRARCTTPSTTGTRRWWSGQATRIEALAAEAVADANSVTTQLRRSLRAQLADLDRAEDRYLDLIGDPDRPQDKIKARLQGIREDKQKTAHQLDNVLDDLTPGQDVLQAALELLDRPRELYRAAPDDARKKLNQAIFNRLYLDAADHTPTTGEHTLVEPYASPVDATRAQEPQTHLGRLLATALQGGCASKAAMVDPTLQHKRSRRLMC